MTRTLIVAFLVLASCAKPRAPTDPRDVTTVVVTVDPQPDEMGHATDAGARTHR